MNGYQYIKLSSKEAHMRRILLVDNDVESCTELAHNLNTAGYTVDRAYSGASAIDHLHLVGAALVVLNVAMRQMDGWHVLNWINAQSSANKPTVIVHSALPDSQWKLAKLHGASELWVRGSCSFAAMCDSLRECLQSKVARAA
jgi:DNA-binding response OmpR family regulator